jgi:Uma2 family endonuclease
MPAARHHWTAADVRDLIDARHHWPRYELLHGELLVTPAPEPRHQLVAGELFAVLKPYVESEGLGLVFMSPADIELAPESITQPDLFVVPNDCIPAAAPMRWAHVHRLLLAVEVLSPASLRQDRVLKRDFYLTHRVEHYWVVDADACLFECWRADQERPTIVRDQLTWTPEGSASPWELDVRHFFEVRCRRLPPGMKG